VLCEKPLAITHDDVDRVVGAARAAGTVVVTGTNHLYDPAWARFKRHLDESQTAVRAISITLAIAPNSRYHAAVSETPSAASPQRPRTDLTAPGVAASIVRSLVLGLGVHDLPLVRDLAPDFEDMAFARALAPIGFDLGYRSSGIAVRHTAVMLQAGADTHWRIAVTTDHDRIELDFPPPFVSVGGARIRVIDPEGRVTEHPVDADNGYLREWAEVADLLDGERPVEYSDLQSDAHFAIDVADAAASTVEAGVAP
jgi:predicted dehydrogenase